MKDNNLFIGDVTSVNITKVNGGIQTNVIPSEYRMTADFRLALDVDHTEFEKQLKKWCEEAGGGIEIEFEQKQPKVPATKTDSTNPYYVAFKKAVDDL